VAFSQKRKGLKIFKSDISSLSPKHYHKLLTLFKKSYLSPLMGWHRELINEILVIFLYLFSVIATFWWLGAHHKGLASSLGIDDGSGLNLVQSPASSALQLQP
jgi:hypothetical protein